MKLNYFSILLTLFCFAVLPLQAQTSAKTYRVQSSDYYNGTKYDYSVNVKYRMQDAGYGDSPTQLKVGFSNFKITNVYYKGKTASSYLNNRNFPVSARLQANISGTVTLSKGRSSMSFNFTETGVTDGGLDNYDLTSSDRSRLFNTLGKDVTYNDVNFNMNSAQITNLGVIIVSDIIDDMKRKMRKEEDDKRREEREAKKAEDDRIKAEEEEQKELEEDDSSDDDDSDSSSRKSEDESDEEAERKREEAKKADEEAKRQREAEEKQRKQEKINAYNSRIEKQQAENDALAASSAAASAGILYLLGGIIYDNMGTPANDLFSGSNFHASMDFGYGFSTFPISFNSVKTGVNLDGDTTSTESNTDGNALTIDLRLLLKFGYEHEYGGGNLYARFEPGFSPIFTDFNTSSAAGIEFFGGHKNAKIYGKFETGTNSFSAGSIDAEEIGEGGKSSTKFIQTRLGLKFSYYRNTRTAKRDHIILGVMENYFNENSAEVFSFRAEPDKPILNIIKTDNEQQIATGFFFEWKRDHTHRLYAEFFPNYPVTGEIGGGPSDFSGKTFLQVGFVRTIEGFFNFKK